VLCSWIDELAYLERAGVEVGEGLCVDVVETHAVLIHQMLTNIY
jgi:hypothetical protein